MNCLSTLQFAIDVLQVQHVIVCGHYGCGGIRSALRDEQLGPVDNWLRGVQEVKVKNWKELAGLASEATQFNRLASLTSCIK